MPTIVEKDGRMWPNSMLLLVLSHSPLHDSQISFAPTDFLAPKNTLRVKVVEQTGMHTQKILGICII